MQQMDRLHPLIDKKYASLSNSFFFIQINSSHFLLLSLIISQMCKNFQENTASFSENVVVTLSNKMDSMDRLHPLIDKKYASLSKSFFFIQINSSHFLLLSLIISQMCKNFQENTASFSENVVVTLSNKMATANKIEEQTFLSFACDHLLVETVSTERFTLMCRLHNPVYLFENSYQNSLIKWHLMVSSTPPIFKKNSFVINLLNITFINCTKCIICF